MISRASLHRDLHALGLRRGDLVMAQAGLRSVGHPLVGGVNSLVLALLDAIGETGTLAAYVDFEPFYEDDDDPDAIPVFDKLTAHAARDHGILHETLRNWPGALRRDHPDAGICAIGAQAAWLTADHPFQYGYGPGSPLAKIVEARGRVAVLGAPLDSIALLHYAEHIAPIPDKRVVRYRRKMIAAPGSAPEWMEFEEFDAAYPVNSRLPEDYFEQIGRAALAAGLGRSGRVGNAESHLFDAPELVAFALQWLTKPRSQSELAAAPGFADPSP